MITVSIMGIDRKLIIGEGSVAILNIHNKLLYRSVSAFFREKLQKSAENMIVIFENEERMESDSVMYIQDLDSFEFDSKRIVDRVVKRFVKDLNSDILLKEHETKLYISLLQPLLQELNLLEVDYTFSEEMDNGFYTKIPKISFGLNDTLPPHEKLIVIIQLAVRLEGIRLFIVNRALPEITDEEFVKVKEFAEHCGITILFLDYLDESEVVAASNLMIDEEFGVYSL